MHYHFTFTTEQAQALWQCIQNAPLPRAMTDDLAAAFRQQIEARNRELEAERATKANGHDQTQPQNEQ